MIKYPILKNNATIGVTAPSSGVPEGLHSLLDQAVIQLTKEGFHLNVLNTPWGQSKAKSDRAETRAQELNELMMNDDVDLVMPPWGGVLLIEILEHINFEAFREKWILGYSDTSSLLLATTLKTGVATAHGTNLIDLRGEETDSTTAMWKEVLSMKFDSSVSQYSSEKYQKEWDHEHPTPHIFNLTENTEWKIIGSEKVKVNGRLLGGCIDTIHHLAGTPYGNVKKFSENYINNEPIIWYLENCEMDPAQLRRSLVQMKYAGWFDHTECIMFGRSPNTQTIDGYTAVDVYKDMAEELKIPIVYDIDCGHVPPQITFINGASAVVEVDKSEGKVTQTFN